MRMRLRIYFLTAIFLLTANLCFADGISGLAYLGEVMFATWGAELVILLLSFLHYHIRTRSRLLRKISALLFFTLSTTSLAVSLFTLAFFKAAGLPALIPPLLSYIMLFSRLSERGEYRTHGQRLRFAISALLSVGLLIAVLLASRWTADRIDKNKHTARDMSQMAWWNKCQDRDLVQVVGRENYPLIMRVRYDLSTDIPGKGYYYSSVFKEIDTTHSGRQVFYVEYKLSHYPPGISQ